jgi:hypothetical protein
MTEVLGMIERFEMTGAKNPAVRRDRGNIPYENLFFFGFRLIGGALGNLFLCFNLNG